MLDTNEITERLKNMQVENVAVSALLPYAHNSRTHDKAQVDQIVASFKEFGVLSPVLVDEMGMIIAGHGRVLAAKKMEMKNIPCVMLGQLTIAQKKAYIIADNKLALNSEWDEEMLGLELAAIKAQGFDMPVLGFSEDELSVAMGLDVYFPPGTEEDQGKLDVSKPLCCPKCKHQFMKASK